jgi:hypothetical protein
VGYSLKNNGLGYLCFKVPASLAVVDVDFHIYSRIKGTLSVTNIIDGTVTTLELEGGLDNNFQTLRRIITNIKPDKDGIIKLWFSVHGNGAYMALRDMQIYESASKNN